MLKKLIEQRAEIDVKLDTLDNTLKKDEKRSAFTEDEQTEYTDLLKEKDELASKIEFEEKRQADIKTRATISISGKDIATVAGSQVTILNKDEKRLSKDFDFLKAVDEVCNAARGGKGLSGLEKEMIQDGVEEARTGGMDFGGARIVISAKYLELDKYEKRTDIDQATSSIEPTFLGPYTDALRENAVYTQIGAINRYSLTGDFKLPVTVAQTLAWATAENSAAADGGANFTSDTLTPFRLAGFVDFSNKISIQNGPAALQAIMSDLGRAEAALINTAMFSTASVTDAPVSIPATTDVLTFTEATFTDATSVLSDLLEAEQNVANDHGLSGNLAYVLSTELLTQTKKGAEVASIIPGMTNRQYNDYQINGYRTYLTTGATKIAGTSGDGMFGDWSRVHFGRFGGLNILVDPFTVAGNDQVRLVVNSNVDWSLVQGKAFVKFTSLTA